MMATTEEQATLKEDMQMLERTPGSPAPSAVPTFSTPPQTIFQTSVNGWLF